MPYSRTRRPFRPHFEPFERRELPTLGLTAHALAVVPPAHPIHVVTVASPRVPPAHVDAAFVSVDPFASLAIHSPADLRPSDILVTTGLGTASQAIRTVTLSDYSHAALYVGGGKVIDATGAGVTERALSSLTEHSTRIGIIRPDGLTASQNDKVVSTAQRLVGKPYNYLGLILGAAKEFLAVVRFYRLASGEPFKVTGSVLGPGYFCSELVIKAYRSAGVTVAPEYGDTPGGIINYAVNHPSRFDLVGRLPPGLSLGAWHDRN